VLALGGALWFFWPRNDAVRVGVGPSGGKVLVTF
jgi:hypothetical protein